MIEKPIDLKEFERPVVVRRLRREDFDAVVALQLRCFPKMKPWSREQFESQLRIFPAGQICVDAEGQILASSSSLVVAYNNYENWHAWGEISDHGMIRNHDPEGDSLYGIEIMVDPEARGRRLARRLYEARKEICRELNLARILIGGRIPGYGVHASTMSAQDYVRAVMDKRLFDPVLTTQLSNGFVLREIIPDYLPNDEDSAGFATFLEWVNLDYVAKKQRRARQAVAPVRVAVVQYQMRRLHSFDEFAQQVGYFVDVAAEYQADFAVFPELITTQLLSLLEPSRPGKTARELAEMTPQYLDLFTDLATRYHVNIAAGSHFVVENDVLYNIAYLFRRDGTIGKQYKLHVTPNERRWWGVTGGNRLRVFDTDKGKVAILLCYDVEFPELARVAAELGAKILLVPFNTNDRPGYLRVRTCAQARCVENQVYAAIAGCVGNLPFVENADIHYAQSGIFTPSDVGFARDGVAVECSANIETVVVHDLDLEQLRRNRLAGTVQPWSDRRQDLYEIQWIGPSSDEP